MTARLLVSLLCLSVLYCLPVPNAAAATQAAARGESADARGESADARAELDRILQQPLYQRWKLRQERATSGGNLGEFRLSESMRDYIKDLLESIGDWLQQFFRGFRGLRLPGGDPSSLLATLKRVGVLVLVFLGLFFCYWLYRIISGRKGRLASAKVLSRAQVRKALEEGEALALDSPAWLEQARHLADEHEFRLTYRALYLALLSGLHSRGRIDFRQNRTNWFYVERFKGPPNESGLFQNLTSRFDEVWYGLKAAAGGDVDTVRQQVAELTESESPRD